MTNQLTQGQEVLEELADIYEADFGANPPDFRADVAPGTVLSESVFEDGHRVQALKGHSNVRLGGKELPERMAVYDTRTGALSMVPTGQIQYQLNKRRQDGSRVYSMRMPQGIVPPTPIEDTCRICFVNRGNRHRDFYSEDQLLNHYMSFHEREWGAMEREKEREQRREDANRLERLIIGLVSALVPNAAQSLPEEVRDQISDLQAKAAPQKKGK